MTHDQTADLTPTPLSRDHLRGARSPIGWMPPEMAHAVLEPGVQASAETVTRANRARAAVAARTPVGQQEDGVILEAPAELGDYIKTLESQPHYKTFLTEGWRVCLADLSRIRSAQTVIHTDHAQERTETAEAKDLLSLARITIPTTRRKELTATIPTPDGRGIMMTCRNPMLRVLGGAVETLTDDSGRITQRVGFQVEIATSMVQVIRWRGCYVLRDGYHRTHGLLSRNITVAPVIYLEFPDHALPLQIPGLFDPNIYLGDRPPMLTDFFDDNVSAASENRKTQKTFVFQWTEIDVPLL